MDTLTIAASAVSTLSTAVGDVWHWFLALPHIEYLPRVLMGLLLGFLIGLERRSRHKAVGVRTYMVISGASALITMCGDIALTGVTGGDPTRLAGQIMSGIGMIGAGVILKRGFNSTGVTTAAFILFAVGAGIAAGFGIYSLTFICVVITLLATIVAGKFFNSKEYAPPVTVVCKDGDPDDIIALFGRNAILGGFKKSANGTLTLVVQPQMTPLECERLLQRLITNEQIIEATLKDAD